MKQNARIQSGFTLIELLIVLAITAALAGAGGYALVTYRNMAARSSTITSLKVLQTGIEQFEIHLGKYPSRLRDLVSNKNVEGDKSRWQGPYIKAVPRDGWNRDFKYKLTPGDKKPYQLYSFGKNGESAPKEEWLSVWNV